MTSEAVASQLVPYAPRMVLDWDVTRSHHRVVEGSLVSADISGFTALSERLAKHGREGAEELTVLLNRCFGGMIDIVDSYGGDVLKFGGDALLILFSGAGHATRAAAACRQMRSLIQRRWSTPLVSRVELGISQGIHSGTFSLHLVHAGYHELLCVGPGVTATVTAEGDADRGQILVSHATAALLDPTLLGDSQPAGRVLVGSPDALPLPSADVDPQNVISFVPPWLVEQSAAGPITEHRAVTVGFLFFGGVDDVLENEGDDAVHSRLQALGEATRQAAERFGVYWLASDVYPRGGKIILTAGAPRSAGHDEDAAVRALRSILDTDVGLPLRAGVNRGHVFMGDLGSTSRRTFTVMGDAVNLAARLMQKSQPGQLVVGQSVLDLVEGAVDSVPLEPFMVKGKTEPIHAALVGAVQPAEQDADAGHETLADEQHVPFVGRTAELTRLVALVDRVRSGHGVVVDLSGEPGIGKTRLVEEMLTRCRDLQVVKARGGRYSRRTPYFATRLMLRALAGIEPTATAVDAGESLTEWVHSVAPSLAEWLPLIAVPFDADVPMTPTVERIGAQNRAQKVREIVGDLLEGVLTDPTLILVEDAHWLDEASDELFGHLGMRARESPWMVLAAHRVDTACFAVEDRRAETLVLAGLTADDSRTLTQVAIEAGVGGDPDEIDALVSRGATNPLFVLELVRAGTSVGAETPDSIEALVTARIDTLDAVDRVRLREGAVLGSVIDVDLLAEATGESRLADPGSWSALSSFVRREADGLLRFQHALYRDVAYEGLSYRRRQSLHSAVGSVLESRAGDHWEESSELLSLHFHAARDWERSWRYSSKAGDRARLKYANVEAAEFYRRALSARRPGWASRPAVSQVAESLGDVLELSGKFQEAEDALRVARRHCDDPTRDVRLLRKGGVLREREGRYTQALRWYGRGLDKARAALDDVSGAKAEGELCIAYAGVRFRQGRTQDCITWAHRAEDIARRIDDRGMLAHASYVLMIGYGVLRRPEVSYYRDVSLPLFEAEGDLVGQANVLNNLGVDAKEEGHWRAAMEYYERSRTARDLVGDVMGSATAVNNIAEILLDQGHLDRADKLFHEALRSWRRVNYPVGVAMATCNLGRVTARRGETASARDLFTEAIERYERINASYFIVEARIFQLEAEAIAGNPHARRVPADLIERTEAIGDPLLMAMLTRIDAWLACWSGDFAEAETRSSEALALAESVSYPYEAALALLVRSTARAGQNRSAPGDSRRARALLRDLEVVAPPPGIGALDVSDGSPVS